MLSVSLSTDLSVDPSSILVGNTAKVSDLHSAFNFTMVQLYAGV